MFVVNHIKKKYGSLPLLMKNEHRNQLEFIQLNTDTSFDNGAQIEINYTVN